MTDLGTVIQAQVSCRSCLLRDNHATPLYLPLGVRSDALIVLDRPYSDIISPVKDPRRDRLVDEVPGLRYAPTTYLTSCWSDPSEAIPAVALRACRKHRDAERAALAPRLYVLVGEEPCQQYLETDLSTARGQGWQLGDGVYAVPVPATPEDKDYHSIRHWYGVAVDEFL